MSSGSAMRRHKTAVKGVRFVSESTQQILDLPTWRRPSGPDDQRAEYEVSAKARRGMAIIRFAIAKLLYIRLPNSRRETLEAYCSQLLSTEQLAQWWPKLPEADQVMAGRSPVRSLRADASYFCEAFAEISGRFGSQVAMDKLLPLVIPVIASWTDSGKLANIEDTNAAAAIASKGKKAGNALGEARTHYFEEYWKRKTHFETYDDPGLQELAINNYRSLLSTASTVLVGKDAEERQVTISIGSGVGPSKMVARELAAEEAVKNWHVVEGYMEAWGLTKPVEPAKEPKPLRERDRTRAGAINSKKD
ncbi:unnamed protein product [Rhizoctonia solani]|uniref:Uncharacterized protein n=1 Tax=Rhizoctonia solani TaxID=456999 RepID=A0A8H3DUU2_9AGAM|nr:unnamed protein product [Rhizoctonia solani]